MSGSLSPWFLANKPTVALADPNATLAQLAGVKNTMTQTQTAQQDLDDRTTLRGLAGGLTNRDPNAMGTAASLGQIGTGAVTALSGMDHNIAADKLALFNADGSVFRVRPGLGGAGAGSGFGGAPAGGGGGASADPNAPLNVPDVTPEAAFNSIQDPAARELVAKTAGTLGMDPKAIPFWVASLHNESGGSPRLNLQNGAAGEIGPGQIMPATGAGMGYSPDQLRDPATNLLASGQYFTKQWQAANGDGVGAMRGYNGGNPGNMKAHGYAVAGVGRMNAWGQPQGGAPVQPGQPVQLNTQVASASGTAGMPQTATDAGGGSPSSADVPLHTLAAPLTNAPAPAVPSDPAKRSLASFGQMPTPPIPPAGGPPPLQNADTDAAPLNIDRPEYAQSIPRGTRYSVAGGPVQVRAGGAWSPTSDQPLAATPSYTDGGKPGSDGVVPGGMAPDEMTLTALGLGGASAAAPARRSDLAAAATPAAGTPHQILANAPQAPSFAAAQSIPPTAFGSGLNRQPMPTPSPQGAAPGVSLANLPGVMPAAAPVSAVNAPQTLSQIGAAAVQAPPSAPAAGGQLANAPSPVPQGMSQPMGGQGGVQADGLPPGAAFVTNRQGEYNTKGLPPGMAMAQLPDGTVRPMPIPGAQKLEQKEVPGALIFSDPYTGKEVNRIAIPDNRRITVREGSDGGTVLIGGQPNGVVLPPNTRPQQAALLQDDYKQVPTLSQAARAQEDLIGKSIEMRDAAKGLPTGYGGEGRAQIASFLQTYFPDAAKTFAAGGSLPDAAQAEQAAKMMMQQSAMAEKANGGSGGLGITEIFMKNNPNLNMQPESIRKMSNMSAVVAMSQKDYLQGKLDHIDSQGRSFLAGQPGPDGKVAPYTPAAAYDRAWFSQNNANTYMGAINAMNGKPFEEWSKGLSPADAQRALGVVARIDPTATVLGRNGHPLPVSSFVPQNMNNPGGAGAR